MRKDTVAKVKRDQESHFARKIQILTVLEQRAKFAKKPKQAEIARKGKEAIRKETRQVMASKKITKESLKKWTKQDWGTKSGKPSTQGKKATGERYLPKKARQALSDAEYAATSRKKRADTKKGKQHSKQPKKIAKKTARHRK